MIKLKICIYLLLIVLLGCEKQNELYANESKSESSDELTPLMHASKNGDVVAVNKLLNGGAEPNLKNSKSTSAMSLAVTYQHLEVLRSLLSNGGDTKTHDFRGELSLLHRAVISGNGDIVNLLINNGADHSIVHEAYGTSVYTALTLKKYNLVLQLLENGAFPKSGLSDGLSFEELICEKRVFNDEEKLKVKKQIIKYLREKYPDTRLACQFNS
ncbi:ankyrin repeat domain-containing protein [Aliiglaciecola litoralis]|uniref:Ankyrin repeat domain-containing protein n=1 Tax=Aliiglaciecola litoralis TaxID=582857 RepID=A0ABN1LCN1_9ALTE